MHWPHDNEAYERYLEAKEEAARDAWLEWATTCEECGTVWDEGWHRATRVDPAYADNPECPNCGRTP